MLWVRLGKPLSCFELGTGRQLMQNDNNDFFEFNHHFMIKFTSYHFETRILPLVDIYIYIYIYIYIFLYAYLNYSSKRSESSILTFGGIPGFMIARCTLNIALCTILKIARWYLYSMHIIVDINIVNIVFIFYFILISIVLI